MAASRKASTGGVAAVQRRPHEQQLGQRLRVEQGAGPPWRVISRARLAPVVPRLGPVGCAGARGGPRASRRVGGSRAAAVSSMRQRVAIDAHADAALEARLEGHRAAAAERVEDHVTRTAPACDEVVCEGRRQAAQVGAHGVQRVRPSAVLVVPFGWQWECGQGGRGRLRAVQGQAQL